MNKVLKKQSIIPIINIFLIGILFFITFKYQQYFTLTGHDYFLFEQLMYDINSTSRIPGAILMLLFDYLLPNALNISRMSYINELYAVIKSVFFLQICFCFSLGFFITARKKNLLSQPVFFTIIALSFLLLTSNPIFINEPRLDYLFCNIYESARFYEYFYALAFYFVFFISLVYSLNKKEKINLPLKIFFLLSSFLLVFWNELTLLSTLFALIILVLSFFILKKKQHVNKFFVSIIVSICIGAFFYIISSDYISGTNIATYEYSWDTLFVNIKNYYVDFIKEYIKYNIFYQKFFLITIFALSFCIIKINSLNNSLNKCIVITSFTFLTGWLIMNLFFFGAIDIFGTDYLFKRDEYIYLYRNILEFIIISLSGCIYFQKPKFKPIFVILCIFLSIFLACNLKYCYGQQTERMKNTRNLAYNVEKINIIYSLFGESAILPISYCNDDLRMMRVFRLCDLFKYEKKEDFEQFMKDKYFTPEYSHYRIYFEAQYPLQFYGFQFKEDTYAQEELQKRISILQEIPGYENFEESDFRQLKRLSELDINKSLLDELAKSNIDKNLIKKYTAFYYYKNEDYSSAINLYKEYLSKIPDDFEALSNLYESYMKINDTKNAEKILNRLIKADNNNIYNLFKLLELNFYIKKDYNNSLNIINFMLQTEKNMPTLYLNKAIICLKLKKTNEAEEIFKEIQENHPSHINDMFALYNISNINELKKIEDLRLLFPEF